MYSITYKSGPTPAVLVCAMDSVTATLYASIVLDCVLTFVYFDAKNPEYRGNVFCPGGNRVLGYLL